MVARGEMSRGICPYPDAAALGFHVPYWLVDMTDGKTITNCQWPVVIAATNRSYHHAHTSYLVADTAAAAADDDDDDDDDDGIRTFPSPGAFSRKFP